MNNAITYAIRYIKREIPPRILNEVFLKNRPYSRGTVRNIESIIKQLIIDEIVGPDANIVGGRELKIDVSRLAPVNVENDGIVLKVPMEMTGGCRISSCKFASFIYNDTTSVGLSYSSGYMNGYAPVNTIGGAAANILTASTPDQISGTADCHVAPGGDNVVFIKCKSRQKIYWLNITTDYDEAFNQISPKSYPDFAELCLFATKGYIYTNMVVDLDEGKIAAGSELGAFKNIIDGYSDANKNYNEYLRDHMEVVFSLNDPRFKEEHYFQVSGGRRW